MAEQDLINYARDAASRGDDLFALLATDATASEADIRRAFRRKALTAHPDKAGDAYDPELYERLERARDVLLTPEAREAYDNGMRAVLQKKLQLEQMSLKRRQLVEDLERREEEAKRAKTTSAQMPDLERAAMAARGRAKLEEMRRLREEAEVRERLAREKEAGAAGGAPFVAPTGDSDTARPGENGQQAPASAGDEYDERIADLEKRLKEKQQRKAEKEQRKAEKKAKKDGAPLAPLSPRREPSNIPPPSTAAEPQADEEKRSATPPAASNPSRTGGFASTLARLRAAQAKKDEEKRRKAEQEAQSAGA
ncbi:DnaJ subfamily C member 17 [Madurella mycetomatis]|uniref:DnaJ subfamily C member 17 n=1 Tax=Madurella mycetomatis TaxID=100816 RepID=A0A175VWR5_9PEZI|nr:DnaJ subfamily C member 17 [Madurella mycetomatis]